LDIYFLRNEQPSVNRVLPPVGWHLNYHQYTNCSLALRKVDLQDLRAALADDDCVCIREDGGDGKAARALDIHEERTGGWHELLELVVAGFTDGC
jgi:hypothetical protein